MNAFDLIEGLERERVTYRGDPTRNLEDNGATDEEIKILCQKGDWRGYEGQRVELNAMTSRQFIEWLERKLRKHGIKKLIPDSRTLQAAYRRAVFLQSVQEEITRLRGQIAEKPVDVPDRLGSTVRQELKGQPGLSWDEVVWWLAVNRDE